MVNLNYSSTDLFNALQKNKQANFQLNENDKVIVTSQQNSSTPGVLITGLTLESYKKYVLTVTGKNISTADGVFLWLGNVYDNRNLIGRDNVLSSTEGTVTATYYAEKTFTDVSIGVLCASAEVDEQFSLTSIRFIDDDERNNFCEGVLLNDVNVTGQDDSWFLNDDNGVTITEGEDNWNGSVYTLPEKGNYEVKILLTAEIKTDEFKCYLNQLDSTLNIEKTYILDWSSNAYGRSSAVTLPTLTSGKKLQIGVYNPSVLSQKILGMEGGDSMYINFEDFTVGPISNKTSIQGDWSGGSQTYFGNDEDDDETIVNTVSYEGTKSWFTGDVQLYGNPGTGSPHTPKLQIEDTAVDETTFNTNLRGKTYNAKFWFYSPSADDGDGSTLKVYNGVYQGNDRTGFNVNIKKTAGAITVTTFGYDSGSFPETTLTDSLSYDTWHLVEVVVNYDADGDPTGDVFTYKINGGSPTVVQSWPNLWRLDNSFTPTYGTQIAFGETAHVSGWYLDYIQYWISHTSDESSVNTHFSIHKV